LALSAQDYAADMEALMAAATPWSPSPADPPGPL